MDIQDVKEVIKAVIKYRMQTGTILPLALWGSTGIGKTAIIAQASDELSEELGIDVDPRVYYPGTWGDMGDGMGLFQVKDGRTTYAVPDWFPTSGVGPLVADELNRSAKDVLGGHFPLFGEGRLGEHYLPDGYVPMALMNPADGDYDVDEMSDAALIARFVHVAVTSSAPAWLDYASDAGVDWTIRSLVAGDPSMLGAGSCSLPPGIKPTPRTWERASHVLRLGLSDELTFELLMGVVGVEAATQWRQLKDSPERPVNAGDVLMKYASVQATVKQYTANGRHDLHRVTVDDIGVALTKLPANPIAVKNLSDFVKDLPEDLAFSLIKLKILEAKGLKPGWKQGVVQDQSLRDYLAAILKA